MTKTNTHWEVIVEENKDGDLFIQLPKDLLNSADWKEGDEIEWNILGNGTAELRKVTSTSTITSSVDRMC